MDRLLELAQSALAEMRSLISHLRPKTVAEEGLVLALRRHVAERGSQDGLTHADPQPLQPHTPNRTGRYRPASKLSRE